MEPWARDMKQGLVPCTLQGKASLRSLSKGKPTDSSKQKSTAHQGPGRNGGSFVAWGCVSRLSGICNLGNFSEQLPAESYHVEFGATTAMKDHSSLCWPCRTGMPFEVSRHRAGTNLSSAHQDSPSAVKQSRSPSHANGQALQD